MTGVGDKWREPFDHLRGLSKDRLDFERLPAISDDHAIGIFEIALDTRSQHVGRQRVRYPNSAAAGFVFVRRADAAQRGTDPFVAQPLLARVVQSTMIGKNQMRTRADPYSLRSDDNTLR